MAKKQIKLISWNVNGIRAGWKKGSFQKIIDDEKPDVLCIQETKSTPDQLTDEMKNYSGYYSAFESSSMRKGYSGVAIYSKEKPINIFNTLGKKNVPEYFLDNEGRTIIAEFSDFYIINCYFPNGGKSPEHYQYKLEYYDHFLKLVKKLESEKHKDASGESFTKHVIFTGDINATNTDLDLARPKENKDKLGCTKPERDRLKNFTDNFIDTYRFINGDKVQYTWWDMKTRSREKNVGWRIDYFYTSKSLEKNIVSATIRDDIVGSDHCPIFLSIKL